MEPLPTQGSLPGTAGSPEARLRVPQSVVFRGFPTETVVLNLATGKYHGLNPTAGRMLEVLAEVGTVRAAAATLAGEYERPAAELEADLSRLAGALLERGLLQADADGD